MEANGVLILFYLFYFFTYLVYTLLTAPFLVTSPMFPFSSEPVESP